MDKQQFLKFLSNPEDVTESDLRLFEELIGKYPYFQTGHLFIAKIAHDYGHTDRKEKLNAAAVCTANRAILKMVIEENWQGLPRHKEPSGSWAGHSETSENVMTETPLNEPVQPRQLDQNHYPGTQAETEQGEITGSGDSKEVEGYAGANTETASIETADQPFERPGEGPAGSPDTEGEEEASAIIPPEEDNKKEETRFITNNQEAESTGTDELSLRKKQQLEIIDNFINYESRLTSRKFAKPNDSDNRPQEDLSLKSSSLNEDLVSENLAMIMKKQGKIDKAIDIYKKLIWKFPQKKAYFASLIEELKKK